MENYKPMGASQSSGLSIETDGEYVLCIVGNGPREYEITRLGLIHGWDWARAVKRWARDNWHRRDEVRARHPRVSLDDAVKIVNNAFRAERQSA